MHKASQKKDIEFRRIVATLKDHNGITLPVAVLQYSFKGKEQDIVLAPHGNAGMGNKRPYMRTQPTRLASIRDSCQSKQPKRVYFEQFQRSGGMTESISLASEPRDCKQIYNARASCSKSDEKDEIFQLLVQLKEEEEVSSKRSNLARHQKSSSGLSSS